MVTSALARLRILGAKQAHVEVRAGVEQRVGRRRNQRAQIERRADHHLLAGRVRALDHDRRARVIQRVEQVERQPLDRAVEQQRGALAAGEDADHDRHVVALHAEKHGRADPRRRRDRRAGADELVDAGQFGHRIHRLARRDQAAPGSTRGTRAPSGGRRCRRADGRLECWMQHAAALRDPRLSAGAAVRGQFLHARQAGDPTGSSRVGRRRSTRARDRSARRRQGAAPGPGAMIRRNRGTA